MLVMNVQSIKCVAHTQLLNYFRDTMFCPLFLCIRYLSLGLGLSESCGLIFVSFSEGARSVRRNFCCFYRSQLPTLADLWRLWYEWVSVRPKLKQN